MSLIKHSSILIVGVIVSNGLAYVFHFIAGRYLGPEDYGTFGALMSLYLLITLPAAALSAAVIKFTARYNSENNYEEITLLKKKIQNDVLLFSCSVFMLMIIFSKYITNFLKIDSYLSVIIVGFTCIVASILPVSIGILQGLKKFRVLSWNGIIESFSRLVLLVIFLHLGFSANGAILAYGLASLVALLLVIPYINESRVKNISNKKIDIKPVYRFAFLSLIINLLMQSIINAPSLLIKHFYSDEFTGFWTSALNIAKLSLFITGAIAVVLFPEISGEKEHDMKRKIFNKALIMALIASSGMAIIFLLFPEILIRILYGHAFLGAVPILQWMGFAMIFVGFLHLWVNYKLAKLQ